MSTNDELLVRLDNLIRTHEGKLIDCHDAAAAIRELEAKLEAALAPERTVAGQDRYDIPAFLRSHDD